MPGCINIECDPSTPEDCDKLKTNLIKMKSCEGDTKEHEYFFSTPFIRENAENGAYEFCQKTQYTLFENIRDEDVEGNVTEKDLDEYKSKLTNSKNCYYINKNPRSANESPEKKKQDWLDQIKRKKFNCDNEMYLLRANKTFSGKNHLRIMSIETDDLKKIVYCEQQHGGSVVIDAEPGMWGKTKGLACAKETVEKIESD
jgi:hypothetical protein